MGTCLSFSASVLGFGVGAAALRTPAALPSVHRAGARRALSAHIFAGSRAALSAPLLICSRAGALGALSAPA